MAEFEIETFDIVDAVSADVDAVLQTIADSWQVKMFAIGKDPQQICIVSYS